MFKFDPNRYYNEEIFSRKDCELKQLARETSSESEMLELIKIENPFLNRELAKNINLPVNLMMKLLKEYSAYTMNVNLAKNPNINGKVKEKLYHIASTEYKKSALKEDLNNIFNS